MEKESNVITNKCTNLFPENGFYHRSVSEDSMGYLDSESLTLPEENVSLVQGTQDTHDTYIYCVWILIATFIVLVSLYSTGYSVLATVLLCFCIVLALVWVVKNMSSFTTWARRRDYYAQV